MEKLSEAKLTRSDERVSEHGEVFTPAHIVKEMLDLLPKEKWAEKDLIFLEPTCGNGQFLVQAIEKKLDAGLSCISAVNTVFGMDIMPDNIEESRLRIMKIFLDRVKAQKKGPQAAKVLRIASIIVHNIFQVRDSIDFMSRGELFDKPTQWESYPFFDFDPTGNGMVSSLKDRRETGKKAKELIKKAGG